MGVNFAGKGDQDVSINKSSTDAPTAGKGGSSVIDFAGQGGSDVDYNNQTTKNPAGKGQEGGPIDSPAK